MTMIVKKKMRKMKISKAGRKMTLILTTQLNVSTLPQTV